MNNAQKHAVMMYIKGILYTYGCMDIYLQRQADSITDTIEKILKENKDKL